MQMLSSGIAKRVKSSRIKNERKFSTQPTSSLSDDSREIADDRAQIMSRTPCPRCASTSLCWLPIRNYWPQHAIHDDVQMTVLNHVPDTVPALRINKPLLVAHPPLLAAARNPRRLTANRTRPNNRTRSGPGPTFAPRPSSRNLVPAQPTAAQWLRWAGFTGATATHAGSCYRADPNAFETQRPGGDGSGGSTRVQRLSIAGAHSASSKGSQRAASSTLAAGNARACSAPRAPSADFALGGWC
jgi:hypothetical protein